jgi:MFS family permease
MNSVSLDRHQQLLILSACLLGLLSTVGAALPYPILPPLFVGPLYHPVRDFLGIEPKLLFGIALAVNPLGLLLGSSLLGPLSDRFGRRRILVFTAFAAAAGHVLCAWALVRGWYPLFVLARFATGLAEGNAAVARAMLADQIEGAARTQAFGWFNGALYIGWLVGPLLAGATLGFGLAAPFLVATFALVVGGVLTRLVLAADAPAPTSASLWQHAREGHSLYLLAVPAIRRLFALQLAFTLGLTAFYEFYPVWLVEVTGYSARGIAWVTAALCFVMAAGSSLAGRPRQMPPLRLSALCAALAATCFAAVALAGPGLGLLAIIAAGLPISFYNALVQSEVARRFGAQHGQGAVMGLVSTVFCVSNIIASLLGSALAILDTRAIIGAGAALSALAAIGLARQRD